MNDDPFDTPLNTKLAEHQESSIFENVLSGKVPRATSTNTNTLPPHLRNLSSKFKIKPKSQATQLSTISPIRPGQLPGQRAVQKLDNNLISPNKINRKRRNSNPSFQSTTPKRQTINNDSSGSKSPMSVNKMTPEPTPKSPNVNRAVMTTNTRQQIRGEIFRRLEQFKKEVKEFGGEKYPGATELLCLSKEVIMKMVSKLEHEINTFYIDNQSYQRQSRRILLNFKDPKNDLWQRFLSKELSSEQLAKMTSQEMAPLEQRSRLKSQEEQKLKAIINNENFRNEQLKKGFVKFNHKGITEIEKDTKTNDIEEMPVFDGIDQEKILNELVHQNSNLPYFKTDKTKSPKQTKKKKLKKTKKLKKDKKRKHEDTDEDKDFNDELKKLLRKKLKRKRKKKLEKQKTKNSKNWIQLDPKKSEDSSSSSESEEEIEEPTEYLKQPSPEIKQAQSPVKNNLLETSFSNTEERKSLYTPYTPKKTLYTPAPSKVKLDPRKSIDLNKELTTLKELNFDKKVETKKLSVLETKKQSKKKLWSGNLKLAYDDKELKFRSSMYYVNGDADDISKEMAFSDFIIGGRVLKEDVWKYINEIKHTKQCVVVIFYATGKSEAQNYLGIMKHLVEKGKYGVILNNKRIKDFYIIPLDEKEDYPTALTDSGFEGGPGIKTYYNNGKKNSMLLGIIVRHLRKAIINGSGPNSPEPLDRKPTKRIYTPKINNKLTTKQIEIKKLHLHKPKVVFDGTPPGSPNSAMKRQQLNTRKRMKKRTSSMINILNSNSPISTPKEQDSLNKSTNSDFNTSLTTKRIDSTPAPPTPPPEPERAPSMPHTPEDGDIHHSSEEPTKEHISINDFKSINQITVDQEPKSIIDPALLNILSNTKLLESLTDAVKNASQSDSIPLKLGYGQVPNLKPTALADVIPQENVKFMNEIPNGSTAILPPELTMESISKISEPTGWENIEVSNEVSVEDASLEEPLEQIESGTGYVNLSGGGGNVWQTIPDNQGYDKYNHVNVNNQVKTSNFVPLQHVQETPKNSLEQKLDYINLSPKFSDTYTSHEHNVKTFQGYQGMSVNKHGLPEPNPQLWLSKPDQNWEPTQPSEEINFEETEKFIYENHKNYEENRNDSTENFDEPYDESAGWNNFDEDKNDYNDGGGYQNYKQPTGTWTNLDNENSVS